jgi:DDE superfamily endonuclease
MTAARPPRCERMTGLSPEQLAELVARVREVVGEEWEKPAVGRPHVLPLFTAVVAALFGLRHNLPDEVVAEVFGAAQATITRYHQVLGPILRWVRYPETEQRLAQAQREGVLVDGLVAPVGDRDGSADLFSGTKHINGQNVQVVSDLDGRVADVGDPVPAARHDSAALHISGIAKRWAGHYAPGGPGMTGDKGHQGTGIITPTRSPLVATSAPPRRRTTARSTASAPLSNAPSPT